MSRVHVFKRVGKYASAAENLSKGLMLCDCTRVAVVYRSGEFLCQRCIDLMAYDAARRYRKVTCGEKTPGRGKGSIKAESMWDGALAGFAKEERAGWGPTEQFLNQLERKAA